MYRRTFPKRLWYGFLHITCRLLGVALFHIRVSGRERLPPAGGALLLSNHQSFFDPLLAGLAADRDLHFLARNTLFRTQPVRFLMELIDTIPLDREGGGVAGLKETLRRIRDGGAVVIFPEGTRTSDGSLARLRPGFCALARRSKVPLVPMAIAGAYEAWPRKQRLPRRGCIHIVFGVAISPEQAQSLDDDAMVAEVQRRIADCLATARTGRDRATCLLAD